MTTFRIGGETEGITISIPKPRPRDERSEGWLDAEIDVRIGVWSGRYAAQFHEWDLVGFADGLQRLSSTPVVAAVLSSLDGYLEVTLSGDELGHVRVSGTAWDRPAFGAHLEFSFEIDQTYLPALDAAVAALIGELGSPRPP